MGNSRNLANLLGSGSTFAGAVTFDGGAKFNDNDKAQFGAGNDLQIYHSGAASFVAEAGAGGLNVGGSSVSIQNAALDENMAVFTQDGAVELYHNNSKKFETTSAGFEVTGNIMPDGDSTRDIGSSSTRFDQIYGDFVYINHNMGQSSVSGGFNIVESASYDDNNNHTLSTSLANKMAVIQIAAGTGLSSFPIYPNGGSGVAFAYNFMDPDGASWNYTTSSINRSVSVAGTSANTFTIAVSSGNGSFTITRTGGSKAYTVAISIFQAA